MITPLASTREGLALAPRVATVRHATTDGITLDLDGEALDAKDAMAGLWTPHPGDRVLAAWGEGGWYVTGLLARAAESRDGFVIERRADGKGVALRARLEGADLTGARLDEATMHRARTEGATLTDASLAYATGTSTCARCRRRLRRRSRRRSPTRPSAPTRAGRRSRSG